MAKSPTTFTIKNVFKLTEPVTFHGLLKSDDVFYYSYNKSEFKYRVKTKITTPNLTPEAFFTSLLLKSSPVVARSTDFDKAKANYQMTKDNVITPRGSRFPTAQDAKNFIGRAINAKEYIKIHYEKINDAGLVERKIHTVIPQEYDENRGLLKTVFVVGSDGALFDRYKFFKLSQIVGLEGAKTRRGSFYENLTMTYTPISRDRIKVELSKANYDFGRIDWPSFVMDYEEIKSILPASRAKTLPPQEFEQFYGEEVSTGHELVEAFSKPAMMELNNSAYQIVSPDSESTYTQPSLISEKALLMNFETALGALMETNPALIPKTIKASNGKTIHLFLKNE